MGLTFSFAEVNRECSRSYSSLALQPGIRLKPLYHNCERLLDHYHPDRLSLLACRAGCGDCCILKVSVLLPEALAIIEYLEAQPGSVRTSLEKKLDQVWTRISGAEGDEWGGMRQSCVFLDTTENCTIYSVRPLLCRGVTSTDADNCKQALNAECDDDKSAVEMNLFQRELFQTAYVGLSVGLEKMGVDNRGFELTGIVRALLRDPQLCSELQTGLRLNWSDLT